MHIYIYMYVCEAPDLEGPSNGLLGQLSRMPLAWMLASIRGGSLRAEPWTNTPSQLST